MPIYSNVPLTIRFSSPLLRPTNIGLSSFFKNGATAKNGVTCPAVPPPVKIIFFIVYIMNKKYIFLSNVLKYFLFYSRIYIQNFFYGKKVEIWVTL